MQTVKLAIQALLCGACVVAVAPSALAGAERGFYIGISGGKSSFDIDKEELDDVVVDSFASQGAPVISGSSTFDDGDNTLAFFAGYRFLPYIAIEGSYLDLGTASYRSAGTVNPPGSVTATPSSLNLDIEVKGFTLAGVGNLPIGNMVDLHGRLGILVARTELSAAAAIGSSSASDSDSIDSAGALFGVGVGLHAGQHWSFSLDWTRYSNVGDENEDDDFETAEGFDVGATSLSAAYRF